MGKLDTFYRGAIRRIISYAWADDVTDTGYKRYYASASELTGPAITYFLTTQTVDSDTTFTEAAGAASPKHDIDFDLLFNTTATIRGVAVVNVTGKWGADSQCTLIVNVIHVDSTPTETNIGTATAATDTLGGAALNFRKCIKVSLTEKTFHKGETLRLNIQINQTQGGKISGFYHDPGSRETVTADTIASTATDLTFDVPFKIEE